MRLNLVGNVEHLICGIEELKKLLGIELCEGGEVVIVEKLDEGCTYSMEVQGKEKNIIKYKSISDFYRALGLFAELKQNNKKGFSRVETKSITDIGVMVDVSRDAVYKVITIKNMLKKLAIMGYNRFMLYTEDTYEIEGYPYFGYLRGRYSVEELKEIDDYAFSFGIEVIPCIQALGHLREALKWDWASKIMDTEEVLLVGEDKTYEFIEAMVSTMSRVFRSRNIHIGMDEAFDLGRGSYLTKHGYKHHYELMIEHLKRVCEITCKYNFKPMMWDDMFFRAAAPNSSYYNMDTEISSNIAESIPEDISLIFWDYYHTEEKYYDRFFSIREKFNNEVIFAGGAWKWMGFAPHYEKTIAATNAALKQCREKGIKQAFVTAWGDDGAEAPLECIDLGLILFSEHAYNDEIKDEWLEERCEFLTGLSMEDFKSMEELELIPGAKWPNLSTVNPSKYLLYQDILMGVFDKHIEDKEVGKHYLNLEIEYRNLAEKNAEYEAVFDLYSKLSGVLSIKADIGLRIKDAYAKGSKEELENLVKKVMQDLLLKLDEFHNSFRRLWFRDCKGHGFDVHDIRIGGVKARINTAVMRIEQYLNGEIDKIEELEDEKLYFRDNGEENKLICFNQYDRIATQNVLV
jgi:hypothetical protein